MVTLKNTTSEIVSIGIRGKEYSIEAESISEPLTEEVATIWKRTHSFLILEIQKEIVVEPKETIPEVKEKVEEPVKVKKVTKPESLVKKVIKKAKKK